MVSAFRRLGTVVGGLGEATGRGHNLNIYACCCKVIQEGTCLDSTPWVAEVKCSVASFNIQDAAEKLAIIKTTLINSNTVFT